MLNEKTQCLQTDFFQENIGMAGTVVASWSIEVAGSIHFIMMTSIFVIDFRSMKHLGNTPMTWVEGRALREVRVWDKEKGIQYYW